MPAAIPYIVAAASVASSASQADSAKKATKKGKVSWNPLDYQQDQGYRDTLDQIGETVGNDPSKPIFDLGQNYATNVLGENYQAFTPEQQQKMVDDQTKQANKGFEATRNQVGSRLANSGLAGSGVAGMDWGGQAANENKAVADIVSNVGNQNIAATQQNKSQAFGAIPGLAQMSQIPLQNQFQYSNILGNNETASNAWNQWNANKGQDAQYANAGIYQQMAAQNSQNANANMGAAGDALGKIDWSNK